ncbi:MAG: hypothetical protein KGJ90_01895 [Patescibacteria group bacterium]|nr:hypothetical protein [Patescibacteria group bacterium]
MLYSDLRSAVQADLGGRIDLVPTIIDNEVVQRVFYYNAENFGSMADVDLSIVTSGGVSEYNLPQYTIEVTGMWYLLGGTVWIRLRPENYETLVDLDCIQPTTFSPPNLYAIYGNKFKLYLTPDTQYPLKIVRIAQIPAPQNDNDSNFWTNDAFALIRWSTAGALCRAYLNMPSMADEYDALAARELERLLRESDVKQSTGQIAAHMQ